MMILSGDPPRSRVLSIVLIVIIAALAVTPLKNLHLRRTGGVL